MNDETARKKLREINTLSKSSGAGKYRNSRRERCKSNEVLNDALREFDEKKEKL